jgi:fatty-acyl-CoA synthase
VCTWGELRERALRLATSIRQSAPAGARIAIASENRPEIVELMFATWAAECVVVPINFKLHVRVMVQILDAAGAALVFASAKIGPELVSATATAGVPSSVRSDRDFPRFRDLAAHSTVVRCAIVDLRVLHLRTSSVLAPLTTGTVGLYSSVHL